MNISKKGQYALRALMHLTRKHGQGVEKIKDIAEAASIPQPFLEQILLQLKNARIVESLKGAEGGYRLRRRPEDIAVGEVIRIIDGALAPFSDVDALEDRVEEEGDYVGLYSIALEVRNAVADILDNASLRDLQSRTEEIKEDTENREVTERHS